MDGRWIDGWVDARSLQPKDVFAGDALEGVAGVHDQRKALRDARVIEGAMLGGDHGAIGAVGRVRLRRRLQSQAAMMERRHVRVGVADLRAAAMEQLDQVERR